MGITIPSSAASPAWHVPTITAEVVAQTRQLCGIDSHSHGPAQKAAARLMEMLRIAREGHGGEPLTLEAQQMKLLSNSECGIHGLVAALLAARRSSASADGELSPAGRIYADLLHASVAGPATRQGHGTPLKEEHADVVRQAAQRFADDFDTRVIVVPLAHPHASARLGPTLATVVEPTSSTRPCATAAISQLPEDRHAGLRWQAISL